MQDWAVVVCRCGDELTDGGLALIRVAVIRSIVDGRGSSDGLAGDYYNLVVVVIAAQALSIIRIALAAHGIG